MGQVNCEHSVLF